MILQPTWGKIMGHFDALRNFDREIPQYGTSCTDSVDCDHGVVRPELEGLSRSLTIATSRVRQTRAQSEGDLALSPCLSYTAWV